MTQPPMDPPPPSSPPPPPPSSPDYGSAPYQPPPPSGGGSGLLGGIGRRVIGIAVSVGLVVAVGAGIRAFQNSQNDADRDDDGNIASEQDIDVFSVKQGDCLDDATLQAIGTDVSSEVEEVHAIPCADAHTLEAYHVFDLEGDEFPGLTQVQELSEKGCVEAFTPFIGVPFAKSQLDFFYLYPQMLTWDELDDRSVVCLVGEPGGKSTTGSLKGVKR